MASEHATLAIPVQVNQPANIHEVDLGSPQRASNSTRSSVRRSTGDPFSGDGQNVQFLGPQNAETVSPIQLQSPARRGTFGAEGGDAGNTWGKDVPQNQNQNRDSNSNLRDYQNQLLPPSPPPGVRLTDTQFAAGLARPARTRTMSTDPNNRLSAGGLSRNASRMRVMPSDHGEVFFTEKHTSVMKGSIRDRLSATIESAQAERDKYAARARATGLALNVAIGLQVLLGSLTTGLSAVATRGHNAAVATTILGALATLVASYLARARGSNEPELSITRVKDLEHFLRECHNFSDDHANYVGHEYDDQIDNFRRRFEELLGNANGERKLSPPGL